MALPLLAVFKASPAVIWLRRLGAPGLILLGLADNSVIPMPGSMDVLTIWLAAHHRTTWPFYAGVATLGAVIGGYVTYRLAARGGRETLEHRLSKTGADKVYRTFERWGFWAVTIPAMLPPPFPIVPSLLVAGAMQYPKKNFLGALAVGRGIRFTIIGFLGAHYGPHIVRFFSRYYKPALITLVGLSAIGGIFALIQYLEYRKRRAAANRSGATKVGQQVA
jgi:membrane protein YqaA with SNARE-associated domain